MKVKCLECGKELGEIRDPGQIVEDVFIAFQIKYVLCRSCYFKILKRKKEAEADGEGM